MSDIAIRARGLSKLYRVGQFVGYKTLRESLANAFSASLHRLRLMGDGRHEKNLKSLSLLSPIPGHDNFIWAIKDVSFEVKHGEVVGIIGRNGAGKTTLLKILTRITEPTDGHAEIHGRVGSLLEVGTGFHQELTGRENIYLNGAVLGMKKTETDRKFDEIVSFAEVEKFIDTPIKRYSSGMQVRLAFSVAAHLEPEILLVDEVLAVGDAVFQKKCIGKMRDVTSQGKTILFVSHNMTAISTLCSRVLVLNEGAKIFDGPVEKGIEKYLSYTTDASSSCVDLESRTQRHGNQDFSKLTNIETLGEDGHPRSEFKMRSSMKVKIHFRLTENVKNLEIGWCIFFKGGGKLQTFISNWEGVQAGFSQGNHCVDCEVPSVILLPGFFEIGVWLKKQGGATDDLVYPAIDFSVIGSNITGYNQYFEEYPKSGVFQRSTWIVEGA